MLIERSELTIREGMEEEFATVLADKAVPLLKSFEGVGSVQFGRGVENPSKFILLVEWSDLDTHAAANKHETWPDFRALLMPYSVGGAMEHFRFA